jgi:DNA repair protein RadC
MNINANIKVKTLRAYKLIADKARSRKGDLPVINDTLTTYDFLMSEVYDPAEIDVVESFYALFLDANNGVKGYIKVSSGGVNAAIADPKVIFCAALKCLASAIVVTHNHPSGNPRPSEIDRKLTKQLSEAAKVLDMVLVDHIVVSPGRYYSFREHGELTFN